jgi:hypothetical protein
VAKQLLRKVFDLTATPEWRKIAKATKGRIDVIDPCVWISLFVDRSGGATAFIGTREGPAVATYGNWPDLLFGGIVGHAHIPTQLVTTVRVKFLTAAAMIALIVIALVYSLSR